jgi:flagellar motility protein MotE (MotC chaperone)
MPRWVTTGWFYKYFDENHASQRSKSQKFSDGVWESNHWRTDNESLESALNNLREFCDENQMEIKSVVPLTRAQSHEFSQKDTWSSTIGNGGAGWGWGLGYGWAYSSIIGFAALLQQVEDVSQDEYEKRMKEVENKKARKEKIADVKSKISELEDSRKNTLERLKEVEVFENASVEEKKGVIGGVKFVVHGEKFKDRDQAQAYLSEKQQELTNLKQSIEELERNISEKMRELESL